jgi:hypothetical protein
MLADAHPVSLCGSPNPANGCAGFSFNRHPCTSGTYLNAYRAI